MRYTDQYTVTIQAMADFQDPQRAQEILDQYMAGSGAYSVKDAVEVYDSPTGNAARSAACVTTRSSPPPPAPLLALSKQSRSSC